MTAPATSRPTPTPSTPDPEQIKTNLDLAWRSHTAQENWTAKVDTKASILFAGNGAAIAAILALRAQQGNVLQRLSDWKGIVFYAAIILCVAGAAAAGVAVYPMLGRVKEHRKSRGTIYFGHLRHRESYDLAQQLEQMTSAQHFEALAGQLIAMSHRNWRKHRILQGSMVTSAVGYLAIITVALL